MRSLKYLSLSGLLAFAACSGDEMVDPDPISITTVSLANGTVGESYNAPLTAAGGDGVYTWSIAAGTLPDGLNLDGSAISGTPTAPATSMVTIEVKDGSEMSVTRDFTLTVTEPQGRPLVIVTADVPNGVLGTAYGAPIAAQGGDSDYSWSISTGSLPPGLSLAPSGSPTTSISGTPTTAGTFMFQVQVMDGASQIDQATLTIEITETPVPLVVETSTLPPAQVGQTYSTNITANGGSNNGYSWSLSAGALPPGLVLDPAGTPSTIILGTPTSSGNYNFNIRVTDSDGTMAMQQLNIVVNGALGIEPPLLDPATLGETYTATLTAVDGAGTAFTWGVAAGDSLPPGLALTPNADTAVIGGTATATGSYTFTIELSNDAAETASVSYTLDVLAPLQIITAVLPPAQDGVAYAASIEAAGGLAANYSWSITSGALPAGLTLQAMGTPITMITGTTTQLGSYPLTIEVRDPQGRSAQASFTLDVTPALAIGPAQIPGRAICAGGFTALTAAGGVAPFTWTVSAGALPTGWQIGTSTMATVNVFGRATAEETANFSIMATDSTGASATQAYTVTTTDDPNAERLAVMVGDLAVDNDTSVFLVDVCGDAPAALTQISPALPGVGDASGTNDHTAFSPDGTAIAFLGDLTTDTLRDLYIYDLSSPTPVAANVTNFTQAGSSVQDFYWSPNSNFLAYTADPNLSGQDQLFFVDVTNRALPGTPVLISQGLAAPAPTIDVSANDVFWSPNSERLVFHGDLDLSGVNELYYANVSNPASPFVGVKIHAAIAGLQDCEDDVVWAPDSSGVLYRCDMTLENQDELWFTNFNLAPSTAIRVNTPGYGVDNDVGFVDYQFNSTGTMAYYIADEVNDASEELWVVPFAAGAPGTPFRAVAALPADRTITSARWNPSGTRLAYRSDVVADEIFELHIVDVSGGVTAIPAQVSSMALLGDLDVSTTPGFAYGWSNGGSHIAYIADQDLDGVDNAYIADVSGAPPYAGVQISPVNADINFDVSQFYWSPNDEWLAFRGDFAVNSAFDLYVTNVAGLGPYLPQQVSLPLPTSGDVAGGLGSFAFRSDSLGVLFESDMIVNNDTEIWMADYSTGVVQPPVAVSPPIVTGQDAFLFFLEP